MRLKLLSTVLLFLNIIYTTTTVAQPSNDNFANAIPVSCGGNYTSSTAQATIDEDDAPDSVSPQVDLDAPNIWYSYTGSGIPEIVTVDLCASGYDTSYLVYTGTSGNLTLVAANDDNEDQCGPGYRSYGTFESDGTTTYYITVTGYDSSSVGDVDLTITCEAPVPDTIETAAPIVPSPEGTGCSTGYSFVLDFATDTTDSGMGGCYDNEIEGLDQFFTWTATTNGLLFSSTLPSEGLGGIIVRNGSAPYDIIDCSKVDQFITPILRGWNIGDDIIIQIYRGEGQTGTLDVSFCLEEKTIIAPPNDTAAGAIPITVGLAGSDCSTTNSNQTVYFNTSTYTTTASGTVASCRPDSTGVDQFFTWTATSTGLLLGENDDAIGIAIRSTLGVEYACAVRGPGDPIKLSGWQLGEELIIQIYNFENSHKDAFSFCLREYNTSENDLITGAIPITPDALENDCTERTLFFSSDGTTDSGLDGSCNTTNTGYDQFFTWTATTNALLWSGLSGSPGIIIRDVAGNEITCANTITPDDTELTGWQVGDELIIQIYDWVFQDSNGTYANNVETSYVDVSFCLKEHTLEIPGLTYVPDDNFEQALIDLGYDTTLDNFVTTANINTVNDLNIRDLGIFDLTGIEDFAALEILNCGLNFLGELDLSNNTNLNYLIADSAALTALNVKNGNNTNVTTFNSLGNIDLFCIEVDDTAYSTTNWTNIEPTTNFSTNCVLPINDECVNAISVPISDATCNNTVSGTLVEATNSNSLHCFGDSPNFTDVWFSFVATETTHNIALQNTTGPSNTVFHAIIDAQTYNCGNITEAIYCSDELESQATGLTIGNTYYIQVYSDVANSTETFDVCVSTSTTAGLTYVPDNNFEQALIDLGLDDVLDDYVITANINTVNDLNIRDLGIFDLTGIEDFAALEILNCGLNFLGELDLSNNTNLNYLIADSAALTALNVKNGNNTNVTTFNTLGNIDLFCIEVDDAAYSTTNWTNIEPTTSFNVDCGSPIQVAAKVYLQGAMLENTNGLMRTDLKDNNYIPTVSPYMDNTTIIATDPVFTATGQDKIVDWIWIELRDANNPTIVIDGKSALLQQDGDIVEAISENTSTPVNFNQVPGDYYIVIKHRNHLGIMSSSQITLSNTAVTAVDFTDSNNQITHGTNAQTTFGMPANTVAMWCGNVNGDNIVQYSGIIPDVPAILTTVLNDVNNFLNFPTFTVAGYNANDVNMDGNTQYTGANPDTPIILQNVLVHPGNFLNFSTFQIVEQLPNNE
jgi:hypothetical protein